MVHGTLLPDGYRLARAPKRLRTRVRLQRAATAASRAALLSLSIVRSDFQYRARGLYSHQGDASNRAAEARSIPSSGTFCSSKYIGGRGSPSR